MREKKYWQKIIDLLFPLECLGCGRKDQIICPRCFLNISFNEVQSCPGCGKNQEWGEVCRHCQPNFFFDGIISITQYNDLIAQMVKKFKYYNLQSLMHIWQKIIEHFWQNRMKNKIFNLSLAPKILQRPDLLIPVPLHPRRYRWRGFNQAEKLAHILVVHWPSAVLDCASLIRRHPTAFQAKTNLRHRFTNIKGAFSWQGKSLKNKKIILIDDVITSGATLNECAKALKQAGASKVWGVVLARSHPILQT